MGDEHYIEVTATIGPIEPPYALHTFGDGPGDVHTTVHGDLAQRIFDVVYEVDHDADMSARIVTQEEHERDHPDVLQRIAENRGRELDRAVAQIAGLEAERDGWRSENDRHRGLYVEAVKERDTLRVAETERTQLRTRVAAALGMSADMVVPDEIPDLVVALIAERDRLRTGLSFTKQESDARCAEREQWFEEAVAERDNLQIVVDSYVDELSHIAFAVADGAGAVHHDDILDMVKGVVAERDRLRAVVDAARLESEAFRSGRILFDEEHEAWVQAHRALHAALDVSGTIGAGSEPDDGESAT